jgi:hypothetical protein
VAYSVKGVSVLDGLELGANALMLDDVQQGFSVEAWGV